MIYVITFIVSLFLFKIGNELKKNNKLFFYVFSALGIIFPCLLAAFRDLSIGTDVNVYIAPMFNAVNYANTFGEYLNRVIMCNDLLYLLITYLIGKISGSISVLFFVIQLLVILPIYISLQRTSKKTNDVILGMFIFFMFVNNMAYNMARQSIALSFCMLSYTYLDDKNYKKFLLFSIIGMLFHTSASIMFLIFLIHFVITTDKISDKLKKLFKIFLVAVTVFGILFISDLLPLIKLFGFSSDKIALYYHYIRPTFNISIPNTLFYLFIMILVHFNKNKLSFSDKNYSFYSFISLLSLVVLQAGAIITYADRISFYLFYPILFIIIPKLSFGKNNKTKNALLINLLIIIIFILYWVVWIVILKYHQTFPYIYIGG